MAPPGTESSNPSLSSGESVSLPELLSRAENPGFPRGCARWLGDRVARDTFDRRTVSSTPCEMKIRAAGRLDRLAELQTEHRSPCADVVLDRSVSIGFGPARQTPRAATDQHGLCRRGGLRPDRSVRPPGSRGKWTRRWREKDSNPSVPRKRDNAYWAPPVTCCGRRIAGPNAGAAKKGCFLCGTDGSNLQRRVCESLFRALGVLGLSGDR